MNIKRELRNLLTIIGFYEEDNIWRKSYANHHDYRLTVNFNEDKIDYGTKVGIGDFTTTNFSRPENLVILECVNRLLEKGYKPESLTLEKRWTLGRSLKGGKADITVTELDGRALFIVECKTWGVEYEKEKVRMQRNGGQLFSYLRQDRNFQYLCLYTSVVNVDVINYENAIVRAVDDKKLVEQFEKGDSDIKLFRDAKNAEELFDVWMESYSCYFHPNGIFDDGVQPYSIELKPLKVKDLKILSENDGSFIHNQFAEILRHNTISDRENAFNKMISLFLCKIVDENKGENEVVDFQWKEGQDTYEDVQDRLQRLYKTGMRDYLKEEVIYFENDYVDKAFKHHKKAVAKDKIKAMLKALKFYSNNEFAFKEVHNERLFEQNAKVLNEVVQLIQPYRTKYSEKTQFLGNLFELLLNAGFKQSEGQFFTPIPIAAFIVACLPFEELIRERKASGEIHKLPKIIDYACGSGHFLTEAIDAIHKAAQCHDLDEAKDTHWTRDYILGIERDYRLARVAKIACFMNGAGDANIIYGNGLDNHNGLCVPESFDALIANPPYSIKDFKQHLRLKNNTFVLTDKLTDNSSEIETLFVERTKQLLKPGGFAGVILPSSILSNVGIYSRTREMLLQNFWIRAIVELGGGTFVATNTNTVILFLQRQLNGDFQHYTYRAESIFDEGQLLDMEYDDTYLLRNYSEQIGVPFDDYKTLLTKDINGNRHPNESLQSADIYIDYHKAFNNRADIKKLKKSRLFKSKTKPEQNAELTSRFLNFLLGSEKEKFVYYCITQGQRVIIIKAGDKEKEKEFLGYEWSKRRGNEGMQFVGPSMLYDKNDAYNSQKVSSYIRNNFLNKSIDTIAEPLRNHVSEQNLSDMIDFEQITCDLRIFVDIKATLPESTKFPSIRFNKIASLEYGKGLPAKTRKPGDFPVMGSNGVDGVHEKYLVEGPGIIVGRKGSAGKIVYSEKSFWPIDTTYWIKFDHSSLLPKFFYWLLRWLDLTVLVGKKGLGVPGLNRNDVHRALIPNVSYETQVKITKEIEMVDENRVDCDSTRLSILNKFLC